MCGALATSPPSGPNRAQEKSSLSCGRERGERREGVGSGVRIEGWEGQLGGGEGKGGEGRGGEGRGGEGRGEEGG